MAGKGMVKQPSESTESIEEAGLIEVKYIGKNHSYTVAGKRFDRRNPKAFIDAKTADILVNTGKFAKLN